MENNKISPYVTNDDIEKILSAENTEIHENMKRYLKAINNIVPFLTPEKEKQLLQNLDSKKTRNELFESYMRFMIITASEYTDKDDTVEIFHDGLSGLTKAVESYSNIKNIGFAEYAEIYIRYSIKTGIENRANDLKIPILTFYTIKCSTDENNSITVKRLADVLQHTEFDARQMYAIYESCKKNGINIIPSADPYINDDIEKIFSARGLKFDDADDFFKGYFIAGLPLTPEEEKHILQDSDNNKSFFRINQKYWRFIVSVVTEYVSNRHEFILFNTAGIKGLGKALTGYEPTENMDFSMLAEWLIRQEIIRKIKLSENK